MMRWWFLIQVISFLARGFSAFVGAALSGLWYAVCFMGTTVIALFVGLDEAVTRIAERWADRAFRLGFSTLWLDQLTFVLKVIASVMIFAGLGLMVFTIAFMGWLLF
jgi:hypothetical protein